MIYECSSQAFPLYSKVCEQSQNLPKWSTFQMMQSVWGRLLALAFNLLPYFIKYNVHSSIMCTWISQWFLTKKLFLFFKNNLTRINHCKFIYHKSHLKPFLSYLPCIVHREYFSIIFNAKKCTLYSIKYGTLSLIFQKMYFRTFFWRHF